MLSKINLKKPYWMKIKLPINYDRIQDMKIIIKKNKLHSVCEEASCPNLIECFNKGTATFLILGAICTRNCPFCDIKHGRPMMPDHSESDRLAQTIIDMKLHHVVITSVDRDDLHDGGAKIFVDCINKIRAQNTTICIEILTPDFRSCMKYALEIINLSPPDIFNHNIENVPRLYQIIKPGADYKHSLKLLELFKKTNYSVPTKSGLILGLGETNHEIIEVMRNLRDCGVTMLTLGQYLRPSKLHLPVQRYITIEEFNMMKQEAKSMGFTHIACGPLVRSSYHADLQASGTEIT